MIWLKNIFGKLAVGTETIGVVSKVDDSTLRVEVKPGWRGEGEDAFLHIANMKGLQTEVFRVNQPIHVEVIGEDSRGLLLGLIKPEEKSAERLSK